MDIKYLCFSKCFAGAANWGGGGVNFAAIYCKTHLKLIFKNRIQKYVYCSDFSFWFYNLPMSHLKIQPQQHLAF